MKVRKGSIVKLKNGQIGMVTYRKSNEELGINIGHYSTIINMYSGDIQRKMLKQLKDGCFGIDDFYCIDDIAEVIISNTSPQAV